MDECKPCVATQQQQPLDLRPQQFESPPSLIYSEQSIDESDDSLLQTEMPIEEREDINHVLCNVIDNINRITDHLRSQGENEAANQFSRDFTRVFQDLYGIIAPWNMEQCLMTAQAFTESPRAADPLPSVSTPSTSWAAIAATAPLNTDTRIIKFTPSDSLKKTADVEEQGYDSKDRRVVWIQSWEENRSLREVSSVMHEVGAIYSMAYAPNEAGVCIVFQLAESAAQFLNDCADHVGRTGQSPFGPNISVVPGLPYPADNDIRRMDPPENARRRLTFARQQLFSHGITEQQFRKDIEDIVGPQNVELLWLFNTGNATVVLSAVPLAKMVRDKFFQYGRRKNSPYEGVMVSYSHDPCERDLRLVSQIPGHSNYVGENGNGHRLHSGNGYSVPYVSRTNRSATFSSCGSHNQPRGSFSNANSGIKRRDTLLKKYREDDGWQTVKKRR